MTPTTTLPVAVRLRRWLNEDLRYDLPASLVVFLVAVPLSLGIAVASGAPVVAGLIAAVVGGIVAGIVGGTPLQVSGPAAGMTVVVASLVTQFGWAITCTITVAAGLLQVALGASHVARAALAISPTVVRAMLAGIGMTIVLGQLHVLLGGSSDTSAVRNLVALPRQLLNMHGRAAFLGLLVIAVLLAWPRMPAPVRRVPGPVVAVVTITALAQLLARDVPTVDLPASALNSVALPQLPHGNWGAVLLGVLTVTVIASVESLLSAVAVDKPHRGRRADLNRELLGQGAANMVSGLLGGLPVTGVIVRSSTNAAAGARTRASAVLHGVWVLVCTLLLGVALEPIPMAVLAGLLVFVGLQLVRIADIRTARQHGELVVYLVTVIGVVTLNLLHGVLLGSALALILMVRRVIWTKARAEQHGVHRWTVLVEGTLSFLSIPRLSRVLSSVPPGADVELELAVDFLDHAAYDHLTSWKSRHEAGGGTVLVDEVGHASLSTQGDRPRHRAHGRLLPRSFLPWSHWQVTHRGAVAAHNHAMPAALRPLVTGVRHYHRSSAPLLLPVFEGLRDGQRPSALFLTCADSRVVPNVLTSSGPGDLFTVRNIGNFVPPPSSGDRSVLACLHYAIEQLAVSTVLICGHSGCGAMKGLLAGLGDGDDPVGQWLRWGVPSLRALLADHPVGAQARTDGWDEVDRLAMVNVARQVDVVNSLSVARDANDQQRLRVEGLFFDIVSARLLMLDTKQQRFTPLPGAEGLPQSQLSGSP